MQDINKIKDLKINTDAKDFIFELNKRLENQEINNYNEWFDKCISYKKQYPTIEPQRQLVTDCVDSYNFYDLIFIQRLYRIF